MEARLDWLVGDYPRDFPPPRWRLASSLVVSHEDSMLELLWAQEPCDSERVEATSCC